MNSRITSTFALSFLLFSACASRDSAVVEEAQEPPAATVPHLAGSAWRCQLANSVVRITFLNEWYAAAVGDEVFWARVEYSPTGQRVTHIQTAISNDGPISFEIVGDRLEIEGDGEPVTCEEQIEPFVSASDAPGLLAWETERAFEVGDVWSGYYECAQGLTDARLRIDQVAEGSVKATFFFNHVPSNTSGSFGLRGAFNPDADTIIWTAGDWMDHEYDAPGERVVSTRTPTSEDGPGSFEIIGDRLEIEGDGEPVTCEQRIAPFVTASDAPSDLMWETQGAFRVGDVWTGQYLCAQGSSDARLQIDEVAEEGLKATFYFSHAPSNTSGSFRLNGTFNPWNDTIVWTAAGWLIQPPDYTQIDLIGHVTSDRLMMFGDIVGPGCTNFTLFR